ncbi:MAG: nucleotidyltransferase family protein [Elusimicrobia bacterium]|nr:nucleotidyltransferase family protein [Elusimicrobiota bacterium]
MNKNPITLKEDYKVEEAKELMLKKQIECIPVLGSGNRIVSAIWWHDIFDKKTKSKKKINLPVVLMAGGEGTRLSPFTKVLPKPLMLIGEKPISEIIMERFSEYDCRLFYMSVNYKSNIIKAYFDDFKHPYKINYINEKKPLGTAGCLSLLKNKIKTTFFVSNCDIVIEADFSDIISFHKQNRNQITLVGSMKHYTIPYGICKTGKDGKLNVIEEKPEYDYLVNTGMYVLEPSVFKFVPNGKAFHMTDLINSCMTTGKNVGVYPISEKSWIDIGQLEELKNTLKRFSMD